MSRLISLHLCALALAAVAAVAPQPAAARETRACVRNSLTISAPLNVEISQMQLDPATNVARPQPTPPKALATGAERCETFKGTSRAPILVEVTAIGGGSRLICRFEQAPISFLMTVSGNSVVGAACGSVDIPTRGPAH